MTLRDADELMSVSGGALGVAADMSTPNDSAKKLRMEKAAVQNNNNLATANNNNNNNTASTTNNNTEAAINNNTCSSGSSSQDSAKNGQNGVVAPVVSASRVVHLRNVPNDANESEVLQLGMMFGKITNVLLLKGKGQAFLEMETEASASQMVDFYSKAASPPQIRHRPIYIQLSTHRELKVNNTIHDSGNLHPAGAGGAGLMGACAANSLLLGPFTLAFASLQQQQHQQQQHSSLGSALASRPTANGVVPSAGTALTNDDIAQSSAGSANSVLRVVIENQHYHITLDLLHSIFSRVGKVLKIVTFNKNNTLQALVQFSDALVAQTAKMTLDGQNIFNGSCTMRIEYSKLQELNVRYNNDKRRDYTNPSLPTGLDPSLETALGTLSGSSLSHVLHGHTASVPSPFTASPAAVFTPQALQGLQGLQGLAPQSLQAAFHQGLQDLSGLAGFGALTPAAAAAAQVLNVANLARLPASTTPQSSVLLVSNLVEESVTPDDLFTLFGVYGDVVRVKILFNKKDSALIQMAEAQQAQLAITHLDKIKLYGKQLRVTSSKHPVVQLPKEGQPDAGLTKDYINSNLHRFKKPGSKNYQNIYPPSATLHLSNIPSTCTEEQIREAFNNSKSGTVVAFKFFPKDRKMALLQMKTVEEAVQALIKMHNFQLSDSSHLRVSFSKSAI